MLVQVEGAEPMDARLAKREDKTGKESELNDELAKVFRFVFVCVQFFFFLFFRNAPWFFFIAAVLSKA